MKTFISTAIILLLAVQNLFAQTALSGPVNPSNSLFKMTPGDLAYQNDEKIDLFQKSRRQKTGAWVMMGVGIAGVVTGVIVQATHDAEDVTNQIFGEESSSNNTGTFIAVAGGAFALGSIPLFIASSRNRTRANLSISLQKTGYGPVPARISKNIPGLTMNIPIGK